MKIPRFWARAKDGEITALGWSFTSQAEAEEFARIRVRQLAERLASKTLRDAQSRYYSDRPMKEPILKEVRGADGSTTALLTRNSYGCTVLNASRALFVDVDFPATPKPTSGGFGAFLRTLLGKPAPSSAVPTVDPMSDVIAKATQWAAANAPWEWRIYRTKAGARLLATHAPFEPNSWITEQVFAWLGADPLYRKLCSMQECFRARLTPKPWRCNHVAAPSRWPFADQAAQIRHEQWESEYLQRCQTHATCELVVPGSRVHSELETIVEIHDTTARVGSGLPLA